MSDPRAPMRHERLERALALHVLDFASWAAADRDQLVDEALEHFRRHGFWRLERSRSGVGVGALFGDDLVDVFLGATEVGALVGVPGKVAMNYALPSPDVLVGRRPGWRASTVIEWNARRPRKPTEQERAAVAAADAKRAEFVVTHGEHGARAVWMEAFFAALAT